MKKTILTVIASLVIFSVYSQTDKGDLLIGGNAAFNGESEEFSARAQVGVFIMDNLAVGGLLEYQGEQFVFNGFVRKYFGASEKGKLFFQAKAGIQASEFAYGAGVGYAIFIRPTIALEFAGYYNRYAGSGYFQPTTGFQIHLPKKK